MNEPPRIPRDRDAAGRPQSSRPRDEFGRPLRRDATSVQPAPADIADYAALGPETALAHAQELIDSGRPFQAHEVLEAAWKAAPARERELWRGLAQIAVGLTHIQRGNSRGAVTLLRRGAGQVTGAALAPPHDIDADGVARAATSLADRIERDGPAGLASLDQASLRIVLRHRG